MIIVTFTRLLEISIVASNFSGLERRFLTMSRVCVFSIFSKSVSLREKNAISEPDTKAEMHKQRIAITAAIILEVVGALNEIIDCAISVEANIAVKMHDNGSVSKI